MGIDKVIFGLFFVAIASIFYTIESDDKKDFNKDKAFMIVENSVVYTLNEKNIERIIESKKFSKYPESEILNDGIIITRIKNKNNQTSVLSADYMYKTNNKVELIDNVKYDRGTDISLNTSRLFYDLNTKIATNDVAFKGKFKTNIMTGTHLYLDTQNDVIKSKQTKFTLDLKENK